jgi:hypothetical protein
MLERIEHRTNVLTGIRIDYAGDATHFLELGFVFELLRTIWVK